jgi:PAS domain S-box-containing protein
VAVAASNLLLIAFVAFETRQGLVRLEAQDFNETRRIAEALTANLERGLSRLDMAFLDIADGILESPAPGAEREAYLKRRLGSLRARYPDVSLLRVVDASGRPIVEVGATGNSVLKTAAMDSAQGMMEPSGPDVTIGDPIRAWPTSSVCIAFARKYRAPDGGVAGVIEGVVSLDRYTYVLGQIDLDPEWTIAAMGSNGRFFILTPAPAAMGRGEIAQLDPALAGLVMDSQRGALSDGLDGKGRKARMVWERAVSADYPMGVIVGRPGSENSAGWKRQVAFSALIALAFFAFSLLLASMIYRNEMRKRAHLEAILRERSRAKGYLDVAGIMLGAFDRKGNIILLNPRGCEILGYSESEILGKNWYDVAVPEAEREARRRAASEALASSDSVVMPESHIVLKDGGERIVIIHLSTVREGPAREVTGFFFSAEDVTELANSRERERGMHEVLELIASGASMGAVLDHVVRSLEAGLNGAVCSVMLLDQSGRRFFRAAGPNLDKAYSLATNGIGEEFGEDSLPAALLRGETVNVEDMRTHQFWSKYREAVYESGLLSCWCKPIFDEEGRALGSLAVYWKKARKPSAQEQVWITNACEAARLAIEKQRALETLRESESRHRFIFEHSAVSLWEEDVSTVKAELERIKASGVADLKDYLTAHPDDAVQLVDLMRVVDVNGAAVRLFGAESKAEALGLARRFMNSHTMADCVQTLVNIGSDPEQLSSFGSKLETVDGRICDVMVFVARPSVDSSRASILVSIFDVTEGLKARRDLEVAVAERGVLLKELQHRVKNTLTIVSSLLSLDESRTADAQAKAAFREAQTRLIAMTRIYEQLYRSDEFAAVDLAPYLEGLVSALVESSPEMEARLKVEYSLMSLRIDVKRAISIGLIVNELVTNAIKYAFPGGRGGSLSLELGESGGLVALRVADDGIGMPEGFDPARSDSLGTKLVELLATQIDARLAYLGGPGTRVELSFRVSRESV